MGAIFDANAHPYSCRPDDPAYDNAAAIEQAIYDAWTYAKANNGVAVIEFDEGQYYLTRELQTVSQSGRQGYYCQVPIPKGDMGVDQYTNIVLRSKLGKITPPIIMGYSKGGVEFVSTLTGQVYSDDYGWPSVFGGPDLSRGNMYPDNYSFIGIELQGLTIRVPKAPTLACINDSLITSVIYENCRLLGNVFDFSGESTEPTSPLGIANFGPSYNDNRYEIRGHCVAAGLYSGFAISEHLHSSGTLVATNCFVAAKLSAPPDAGEQSYYHGAIIQHLAAEGNPYLIAVTDRNGLAPVSVARPDAGKIGLYIGLLDIEEGGAELDSWAQDENGEWQSKGNWQDFRGHIHDPNNVLSGKINYLRVKPFIGNFRTSESRPLLLSGGSDIEFYDMLG
jgi:hypothetical protein